MDHDEKVTPSAATSLSLARAHLKRVQGTWDPPDWPALSTFAFYALEAAVTAAALRLQRPIKRNHPAKVAAARELSLVCGLPDVSELLQKLNEARKSAAYGDVAFPEDLEAETVASEVEQYVEAVGKLLNE